MVPTMVIYSSGDQFRGKVPWGLGTLLVPTMGNLGHLEPICQHTKIVLGYFGNVAYSIPLSCAKGNLEQLSFSGIIP